MQSKVHPPRAPVLLESMRAIGYTPAAAVADLVDNSIAAGAGRISIRFRPGRPNAVAILDDGKGMTEAELLDAMRHGSRDPNEDRTAEDLGRFGLGLKTASMSQCRRLTVVSCKDSIRHAMVWDLDHVAQTGDWSLGILDADDTDVVPFVEELRGRSSGTLVVWEQLDRLAAGDLGDGEVLSTRMQDVASHLSLVFHRFLSRSLAPVHIDVNLRPLVPVDPFLEQDGSIVGQEEHLQVQGHSMVLRAFTLPHISRLTREQIEKAGGEQGLRRRQGFYVYRNQRLIVAGTWFRLFRQEELTKLTRVRVDVSNALDHLWNLDIKKSAAFPPQIITERLRRLVPTMVQQSRQSNQYRGRPSKDRGITPVWSRIEDRDGIRYEINRDHPIIDGLRAGVESGQLAELDNVLGCLARCLPIEAIYNDRANDVIGHRAPPGDHDMVLAELEESARLMLGALTDDDRERDRLIAGLAFIEPFALHPELLQKLQERLAR